ncbi:MAG: ComF family protein [Planctomycetes bacterium]|nr:ComF family protein [Planctomycetota bacterium]
MSALDLARDLATGLLSLLAPRTCAACLAALPPRAAAPPGREWAALLCPPCRRGVEPIGPACPACGAPRPPFSDAVPRCGACRDRPRGEVAGTVALLRYRGPTRRLLHRVKYGGRDGACEPLGLALGRRVTAALGPPDPALVVVPVPLHLLRRWARGFNQAERMAEGVAEALGRPLWPCLARRRRTPALFGVRREARDAVVAGAFRARRDLGGRPALLVDDIRTSGATLRAAAAALVAAGAGPVVAAVVAR